jgi:hypothetical protein
MQAERYAALYETILAGKCKIERLASTDHTIDRSSQPGPKLVDNM